MRLGAERLLDINALSLFYILDPSSLLPPLSASLHSQGSLLRAGSVVTMFFIRALAIVSFLFLSQVAATPCVGFDINWGLYVFGLGRDVSLGPSSGWNANPLQGTTLTRTGRPPFNGPNTQCFFSQFQNALYVLNADTTQPSNMHIYNFDSQSWTTQQISAAGTDPNILTAILDRDTNVFFALSRSQLYSLDMGTLTQADGNSRSWNYVQDPPIAQNNAYPHPVMALGTNHIHYLNRGTPAQVDIFVIHFAYAQPEPQLFSPMENDGQGFPSTTGQTATIFKGIEETQQRFVFIPDDGTATYVFDTNVNTTQAMAGPTDKSTSRLAASQREIVQMTISGDVYWIPYNPDDATPNYGATWSKLALSLGDSPSGNSTGTGTHTSTTTSTSSNPSPTSSGGAPTRRHLNLLPAALLTLGLGACGLWTFYD